MKKQIKANWQTIAFTTIAVMIFMFAANSTANAQTTYKVGERVEVMSAGKWVEAEITEIRDTGEYVVRVNGISGAWYKPEYMRPIKAKVPTDNQGQNQRNEDKPPVDQTNEQNPAQTGKTNTFGTRDPQTCDNTKAPATGAITAALALKYLKCQMEFVRSDLLYLVENVKVEVGGGRTYNPNMDINFPEINVRVPVYPIRGSLLRYQCHEVNPDFNVSAPGKNCNAYNEPKAKGFCYKTTFGDWKCSMSDGDGTEKENVRNNVAPPKP